MLHRSSSLIAARRPGVVLLVVMALLALFATVGLSFVFYADGEAVAAKLGAQALVKEMPEVDPEDLASFFLNQMIYDTNNQYSAARGWSLARSIYGYNPAALNVMPYNGSGRLASFAPNAPDPNLGVPMSSLINYQTFWNPAAAKTIVRTPEFYGSASVVGAPPTLTSLAAGGATYRYAGGANAPWTAYDTNSLYLAQVGADGTVYMPSFYRPWNVPGAAPQYQSLFPDKTWNGSFYPVPDADTPPVGQTLLPPQVKNLEFGPGMLQPGGIPGTGPYYNNDSYWMDMGFPVMTAPNGKRYKVLFAPLVMDLSNRLHLWAHGNQRGTKGTLHVSNEGFSPTEVNLAKLPGYNAAELAQLFALKYGAGGQPAGPAPTFSPGSWFSLINANGENPTAGQTNTGYSTRPFIIAIQTPATAIAPSLAVVPPAGKTAKITVAATGTTAGFPWYFWDAVKVGSTVVVGQESVVVTAVNVAANDFTAHFLQSHAVGAQVNVGAGFPLYPISGGWNNGNAAELTNLPSALNLFTPQGTNLPPLPMSNQEALLRYNGTNSPALTSEAFRRMPITFSPANNPRNRNMVTLANWHLDRITGAPYLPFDRTLATPAGFPKYVFPNPATPTSYPTLSAVPTQPNYGVGAVPAQVKNPSAAPPWNNEYTTNDWRSTMGHFLRMDLVARQSQLTAYPGAQALPSRVQLAKDIYNALIRVTGAHDPNVVASARTPTNTDYQAARWLAQLAVNMVDFMDSDTYNGSASTSINTAWNWYAAGAAPEGWVYGTELPALVMNEVYAQQDATLNVWAELLNPLSAGNTVLQGARPYYEIEIYASTPALTAWLSNPANSQGSGFPVIAPATATAQPLATLANWTPAPTDAATTAVTTQVTPVTAPATIVTRNIQAYNALVPKTGASEAGTTVTIHLTAAHGLTQANDVGRAVTINGVMDNTGVTPIANYDGTFVITAVPSTTSLQYQVAPGVTGLKQGGLGTATFVTAGGNAGYYVVGPAQAQYTNAARVPNLPATLATPTLAITPPQATIKPANNMVAANSGATHVGTTVTIHAAGALPPTFAVGEKVVVANVQTKNAMGTLVTTPYNGTWTIATVNFVTNSFTYVVPAGTAFPATASGGGTASLSISNITLLLRRLANPNLVFNAASNPYITVDYVDQVPVNQGANPSATFSTVGRAQPYAAVAALTPQVSAAAVPNAPQNTFFAKNSNATVAYDWLVHLDRAPINPLELAHVSGYKPHQLTQQFVTAAGKFQHYAPWKDPNALIYRVLDQMSTHYMAGAYTGGRFPGNINLNTVTEVEIFQALCDAHDTAPPYTPLVPIAKTQYPDAWFTQADVSAIFTNLTNSRGAPLNSAPPGEPQVPFKSFSAGTIAETFARPYPAGLPQPLFVPPSAAANAHPYLKASLLQKIYNNITPTSNVFAIWWTVGYFEVVDESVMPPRLGQEIGRSQNRHIRHRFFAVVDRSGLTLNNKVSTSKVAAAGAGLTVTLADPPGVQQPWVMTTGMLLEVIPPPPPAVLLANEQAETIIVGGAANTAPTFPGTAVGTGKISADFKFPHSVASTFVLRGNPGPRDTGNLLSGKSKNAVTAGANKALQITVTGGVLQPGMFLQVGNTEVIFVKTVAGTTVTADFTFNHAAGVPVVTWLPNNNPRDDTGVVLHLSVIK